MHNYVQAGKTENIQTLFGKVLNDFLWITIVDNYSYLNKIILSELIFIFNPFILRHFCCFLPDCLFKRNVDNFSQQIVSFVFSDTSFSYSLNNNSFSLISGLLIRFVIS